MPALQGVDLAWICLVIAGLLEVVWSLSMKASDGFSRPGMTGLMVLSMGLSIWLLSIGVRALPVGTAYAVWTGIGAAGAAAFGILIFHEPAGAGRLACIALIVVGVVGLKVLSPN
jgi:quaternary ammonium compound-resistance protein SugE